MAINKAFMDRQPKSLCNCISPDVGCLSWCDTVRTQSDQFVYAASHTANSDSYVHL